MSAEIKILETETVVSDTLNHGEYRSYGKQQLVLSNYNGEEPKNTVYLDFGPQRGLVFVHTRTIDTSIDFTPTDNSQRNLAGYPKNPEKHIELTWPDEDIKEKYNLEKGSMIIKDKNTGELLALVTHQKTSNVTVYNK